MGVDEGDEAKDDEAWEEVVCLVVQQVVDHPVGELLRVAEVRNLKPETVGKLQKIHERNKIIKT